MLHTYVSMYIPVMGAYSLNIAHRVDTTTQEIIIIANFITVFHKYCCSLDGTNTFNPEIYICTVFKPYIVCQHIFESYVTSLLFH